VGAAGGRPYLVLEYVEGGSLARRLAGTPQPARAAAELAQTLARAVQHAHEQHILHRDLKPANVLLTADGVAKVTDFGLAKLLPGAAGDSPEAPQTQSGAVLGTPSYMAPEQAAGKRQEVGPATDVYALGAILYELLTGRPPFKAETPLDTLQQVLAEDPVPVRRLQPKVPRDLETICLKCLEKEPARRYASAADLAEDLARFLGGAPIRARPSSLGERARKWARRKPAAAALLGVSGLALLTVFGLVLGFTVRLRAALEATQEQRDRAERERAVAQAVNAFLQNDLLGQADVGNQAWLGGPAERNPDLKVSELLDRAAARVGGKFPDQPEVEIDIRLTIGDAYHTLGKFEQAQEQLDLAVAWRREHLGADHPATLKSLNNLALLYRDRGRLDEAEPLLEEALAGRRRKLGPDHPSTLQSLNNLAMLYKSCGRYAEAEPLLEEALAGWRRALGPAHPDTLRVLNNLAMLYRDRGRLDEAEPLLEEALAGCRELGADHPLTLLTLNNLAELHKSRGRYDRAEPLLEEALAGFRRTLGADHPHALTSLHNLATLHLRRGRYEQGEPLLREALEGRRRRLGDDHPDTIQSLNNLAMSYDVRGRYAEAEPLYLEAVAAARRKLGLSHPTTQNIIQNAAGMLELARKPEKAEPLWRELADAAKQQAGADSLPYAARLSPLGVNLLKQRKPAGAEPLLRACLAIRRHKEPDAWTTFHTQSVLGEALALQKKHAEAEPLLLAGYEGLKARAKNIPPQSRASVTKALERLVRLYDAWGKPEQAREWRHTLEQAKTPTTGPKK
jgi:tetratricopeptide (TPR) repeat protein